MTGLCHLKNRATKVQKATTALEAKVESRIDTFILKTVISTPTPLEQGVLYISERFKTAIHLCACGCGEKVVTPLNPSGWSVRISGGQATLNPSIGNWSMKCKSHYFIRNNKVVWARPINQQAMRNVFASDHVAQEQMARRQNKSGHPLASTPTLEIRNGRKPLFTRLWNWLLGR